MQFKSKSYFKVKIVTQFIGNIVFGLIKVKRNECLSKISIKRLGYDFSAWEYHPL